MRIHVQYTNFMTLPLLGEKNSMSMICRHESYNIFKHLRNLEATFIYKPKLLRRSTKFAKILTARWNHKTNKKNKAIVSEVSNEDQYSFVVIKRLET